MGVLTDRRYQFTRKSHGILSHNSIIWSVWIRGEGANMIAIVIAIAISTGRSRGTRGILLLVVVVVVVVVGTHPA